MFFFEFQFDQISLSKLIVSHFPVNKKIKLALDRTNWDFGQKKINFLVLGAQFHKQSIPLMCWELDKSGNSNTSERIEVIESLLKVIPKKQIEDLTAEQVCHDQVYSTKGDTKIQRKVENREFIWFFENKNSS